MFTQSYIDFFQKLSANNSTAWFNANKKTYDNEVKKPFETFVQTIIDEIHQLTPEIGIVARDAIFRINKDIRFSADKSPYKTGMSALISKAGKKANPCPGLYINLDAEKVIIGCGLKMLEKQQLYDIRYHIANNLDTFESIITQSDFKAAFGDIQGDKIKRLPAEFKAAAQKQAVLYHTSFLAIAELPAEAIMNPDFVSRVINLYNISLPFAMFLREPLE